MATRVCIGIKATAKRQNGKSKAKCEEKLKSVEIVNIATDSIFTQQFYLHSVDENVSFNEFSILFYR